MIVRGARALVILLAVLWLGLIWRLNPNALTDGDSPPAGSCAACCTAS